MNRENNEDPLKTGDQKVPAWIKLIWLMGIIWMVVYVILGLQHNSTNW